MPKTMYFSSYPIYTYQQTNPMQDSQNAFLLASTHLITSFANTMEIDKVKIDMLNNNVLNTNIKLDLITNKLQNDCNKIEEIKDNITDEINVVKNIVMSNKALIEKSDKKLIEIDGKLLNIKGDLNHMSLVINKLDNHMNEKLNAFKNEIKKELSILTTNIIDQIKLTYSEYINAKFNNVDIKLSELLELLNEVKKNKCCDVSVLFNYLKLANIVKKISVLFKYYSSGNLEMLSKELTIGLYEEYSNEIVMLKFSNTDDCKCVNGIFDENYEIFRTSILDCLTGLMRTITLYNELVVCQRQLKNCEENEAILNDINALIEQINKLKKQFRVFENTIIESPTLNLKQQYLEYIIRYGIPINGIFDAEKLGEIINELNIVK